MDRKKLKTIAWLEGGFGINNNIIIQEMDRKK
jgi:hypothetical protein